MSRILLLCCLFLWSCQSSPTSIEEGEWHIVRGPSTDFHYSAIHFVDQHNGWAVGYPGKIIHTADGGNTWEYQQSGTTTNLQDVYFIDSETGWAAGYSNTIIHTTNGGKSWTLQSIESDTAKIYYDIYFANENTGWIVSNYGEILHTGDGGATWSIQTRSESSGGPKCLSFISDEVGFAVLPGLTLLKTINGGATWSSAPLQLTCPERQYNGMPYNPFDPTDLFFTDEQHGWIATLYYGAVAMDSTPVFYTSNGGDTWYCQNSLFVDVFQSIHFVDNQTGWTIGSQGVKQPSTNMIFQSTDGGRNWSLQLEEEGLFFQDIYFTDAEHGWVLDHFGAVYKYTVP